MIGYFFRLSKEKPPADGVDGHCRHQKQQQETEHAMVPDGLTGLIRGGGERPAKAEEDGATQEEGGRELPRGPIKRKAGSACRGCSTAGKPEVGGTDSRCRSGACGD